MVYMTDKLKTEYQNKINYENTNQIFEVLNNIINRQTK